ncbi:hypothetical protein NE237_012588 [Protea cynaroides]|uniref:Uncharacterized protein n=1 Tax=Protea cynaroides TaxID=273540 RepID=A0A9Q0JYZ4_9MAGN|nr:hypothetical protein NE237_012588 [Protea cynaroides]
MFYVSIYLITLGNRGNEAAFAAFGADQFDEEGSVAEAKSISGESFKKVTHIRTSDGKRNSSHQNNGMDPSSCCISVGRGTATHSAVRKNQMMNGNHLLNFYYDPTARPQPRITPPTRQQKTKPHNKDLFLQANFKFDVLDTGSRAQELMDLDKMLD